MKLTADWQHFNAKPSAGRRKAGWEIRSQLFLRILKLQTMQSCSLLEQRREPRHERWLCRLQSQPALSTWMLRTSCSVLHSLPKTNVHIAGSACASKGATALVACVSVAFFSEKLKKTTLKSTCCHRLWAATVSNVTGSEEAMEAGDWATCKSSTQTITLKSCHENLKASEKYILQHCRLEMHRIGGEASWREVKAGWGGEGGGAFGG